jgi:FdhD protein
MQIPNGFSQPTAKRRLREVSVHVFKKRPWVFIGSEVLMVPSQSIRYIQFQTDKTSIVDADTIVETPVSLTVNGENWLTFMCTPTLLEELAIGFLYNEGILENLDEVSDVRVCEHGDNVDVWLNHKAQQPTSWRRTSGCTGGVTGVDLLANPDISFNGNQPRVPPETIMNLVEMLIEVQSLYRKTGGVHTSALSNGEKILVSAEDIGRHNTLDKIAGLCLMKNVWPQTRILITTGRISSEMLQKAARLNAPILISRTSPSSLSIEMAERYGITLIGYARRHRFNVYSNLQRIGQ